MRAAAARGRDARARHRAAGALAWSADVCVAWYGADLVCARVAKTAPSERRDTSVALDSDVGREKHRTPSHSCATV